VLAGDGAVVVDEGLERLGQVEHLALAVELHPRAAEVVGQHQHADPGVAPGVGDLGALGVGRDHEATLGVHAARDR
jgi:hypothetical protein